MSFRQRSLPWAMFFRNQTKWFSKALLHCLRNKLQFCLNLPKVEWLIWALSMVKHCHRLLASHECIRPWPYERDCAPEHGLAWSEASIQRESKGYLRDFILGPSVIRSHRQDIGVRCHLAQCPSSFVHLCTLYHKLILCMTHSVIRWHDIGAFLWFFTLWMIYPGHPRQRQGPDADLEILVREIGFDYPEPLRHRRDRRDARRSETV